MIKTKSLRMRLTLWYSTVLVSLIVIFFIVLYSFVNNRLQSFLKAELLEEITEIEKTIKEDADGSDELTENDSDMSASLFKIVGAQGKVFISDGWIRCGLDSLVKALNERDGIRTLSDGKGYYLFKQDILQWQDQQWVIQCAVDRMAIRRNMRALLAFLMIGVPLAIALSLIAGNFLATRLLAPIGAMASKAEVITAEHLDQRLPVVNPDDELGQLAVIFNKMLDQLQSSFESMRRFTSDASHELRTPLTAMKSTGEVALRQSRPDQQYRDVIGSMLEEVERLSKLVENLLLLTRGDYDDLRSNAEILSLGAVAEEAFEDLMVLAEEKQQKIRFDSSHAIVTRADRQMLRQAVYNILDNAIKYTPEGGTLSIRVFKTNDHQAAVEIADTGIGIAPDQQQHLFERFYRTDSGRSAKFGGYGLGLAIAQQAIRRNGGRIEMRSEPGKGSVFTIILPCLDQMET